VALFLVVQVPIMLLLALLVALAIDSGRLHGKAGFFRVVDLPAVRGAGRGRRR
jgi:multiple sugar transport system permease protein